MDRDGTRWVDCPPPLGRTESSNDGERGMTHAGSTEKAAAMCCGFRASGNDLVGSTSGLTPTLRVVWCLVIGFWLHQQPMTNHKPPITSLFCSDASRVR